MALDISGDVVNTTKAVLHTADKERFLLVREPDGAWGLPGGAKDAEDVNIIAALQRELKEELSLNSEEYSIVDPKITDSFIYGQQGSARFGLQGINNFFIVEVRDTSRIKKEEKLLELRWFEAEEASEKLEHISMRRGFKKAVNTLRKV